MMKNVFPMHLNTRNQQIVLILVLKLQGEKKVYGSVHLLL